MNKTLLVLVLGVSMSLTAQAQTVYRTTDAQGNVIFTDNPERGGEEYQPPRLTVVPSRGDVREDQMAPRTEGGGTAATASPGQPFMPYDSFIIRSPANETTLPLGAGGGFQVELGIEPALREDHRVRLLLDGRVSQSAMHTEAFMVAGIERGEHVLQAELLDASGEVRHRTSPVILYVQRASVNLPQNPNNPAN
jgi:hypothetical protein